MLRKANNGVISNYYPTRRPLGRRSSFLLILQNGRIKKTSTSQLNQFIRAQLKSNQAAKKGKSKKRYTSINELPEEVQKAIKNMKVSYTIETVGEWIHPDVKRGSKKKRRSG